MLNPFIKRQITSGDTVNLTPIIDIVFLLIIFFLLVCQFIVVENFEVAVPDEISSAQFPRKSKDEQTTIVTVMTDDLGGVRYAVGSELIADASNVEAADAIAFAINRQLDDPSLHRRVIFRNDKSIPYKYAKVALAGISRSQAATVQWAVIREDADK